MSTVDYSAIFTRDVLDSLFPATRSDDFFEAMYGDAVEGAYDIVLEYQGFNKAANSLIFELHLKQRPGKCLACNLTYGLPPVFSRHPIIDVKGVVGEIVKLLGKKDANLDWALQSTRSVSAQLHIVPLEIRL